MIGAEFIYSVELFRVLYRLLIFENYRFGLMLVRYTSKSFSTIFYSAVKMLARFEAIWLTGIDVRCAYTVPGQLMTYYYMA